MRLGIDASNLRAGGGITHLVGLLGAAEPEAFGIDRIVVWGGRETLEQLPRRPWLNAVHEPALDRGTLARLSWQRVALSRRAREACDVLLAPGGSFAGSFRPFVTISRNALPFEPRELARYGFSRMSLRLLLLRTSQSRTFRRADGMIFLTRWAERRVTAVAGPRQGKTTLIPHGVDARFFRQPRAQRPIDEFSFARPFRLLYVSIVDVYKHQGAVVEAVARLRREGVPVALDLVGGDYPPAARRLERILAKLDADGAFVRRLGAVPHAALHETYAAADAFVYASTCENMPNVLLEAMAAGLPIASSDRGPMPEILGEAGVYFDPENSESTADALRRIATDGRRRAEWARAAYERAQAFSWERCARDTLGFIAAVASQRLRI